MRCDGCYFWNQEDLDDVTRKNKATGKYDEYWYKSEYGVCERAEFNAGDERIESPMIANDGSGYWGCLWVKCDHSCKEYKEKK